MAQFSADIVSEVVKLKGQKRSIKQIVERMAKKGTTLTISDVGAILGGAEAGTITTTEATKEGEVLAAAASVASTVLEGGHRRRSWKSPVAHKAASLVEADRLEKGKKPQEDGQRAVANKMKEEGLAGGVTDATMAAAAEVIGSVGASDVKADNSTAPLPNPNKVYRLKGPKGDRYERLPKEIAQSRNSARQGKEQWVEVSASDIPADVEVVDYKEPVVGKERERLSAEAKRKDAEADAKKASERVTVEPKKEETEETGSTTERVKVKKEKADKPKKESTTSKAHVIRPEWKGMGMCAFLRFLGAHFKELDKRVAMAVSTKVGFDPDHTTVKIQTRKGANKLAPVPTPEKDVVAEITTMVKEAKAALPKE
jgi:hypothetical protein